jgi:hypothetical protein
VVVSSGPRGSARPGAWPQPVQCAVGDAGNNAILTWRPSPADPRHPGDRNHRHGRAVDVLYPDLEPVWRSVCGHPKGSSSLRSGRCGSVEASPIMFTASVAPQEYLLPSITALRSCRHFIHPPDRFSRCILRSETTRTAASNRIGQCEPVMSDERTPAAARMRPAGGGLGRARVRPTRRKCG